MKAQPYVELVNRTMQEVKDLLGDKITSSNIVVATSNVYPGLGHATFYFSTNKTKESVALNFNSVYRTKLHDYVPVASLEFWPVLDGMNRVRHFEARGKTDSFNVAKIVSTIEQYIVDLTASRLATQDAGVRRTNMQALVQQQLENVSPETNALLKNDSIELHQDLRNYSVKVTVTVTEQTLGNLSTFLDDLAKIII